MKSDKSGDLPVSKSFEGRSKDTGYFAGSHAGFFVKEMISVKNIAQIGLFIALGIVLGFALIHIPNVELITATIFIGGYIMGIKAGILIGIMTEALYSLLNPYGLAAPPLYIAQVLAMGFTGLLGGISGNFKIIQKKMPRVHFAAVGLISTVVFAVLTTLGYVLFAGLSFKTMMISFFGGLLFYVTHLLSNCVIFFILVPVLLKAANKTNWFPIILKKIER